MLAAPAAARGERPTPIGTARTTLTYMTHSGPRVLTGEVDFNGRGPRDAVQLSPDDENIHYMNSYNAFGRRLLAIGALYDNESLISHSFFKETLETRRLKDYFADIKAGSAITVEVRDIKFDRRVEFQMDTFMMHKLWDIDQMDQLPDPYIQFYNHDTASRAFRDLDAFFPNVFSDSPPNYRLGTLLESGKIEVAGGGTTSLSVRITIPYAIFKHFEERGQKAPPGLPAPYGFLEPWHFHIEYAVRGASCQYAVGRSRARHGCRACPQPGELVSSGEGCDAADDCRRRYKGTFDCPEGGKGSCKVKGERDSCAE
ncbi:MAG: hypothetical protein C4547_06385 [Phycisphaerales bacterium]|nr:MAG: hypothetical protein C4547_06385 [Phycisphaerales bacterium]